MKTIKIYLILLLSICSFIGNYAYGQYAPGTNIPVLQYPWATNYDYQHGNKGFVRLVGDDQTRSEDLRCFSIITAGAANYELFRVTANGTTSIFGRTGRQPALNFYTANNYYIGSIGFPGEEMTLTNKYGIRLNPGNNGTKAFFNTNIVDIYTPLALYVTKNASDGGLIFKAGKNNDPTIYWTGTQLKTLRIGNNGGIGLWTNGKVELEDIPTLWLGDNKVSIGMLETPYKLNVAGNIYSQNSGIETLLGIDADATSAWFGSKSNHGLHLGANNQSLFYIDTNLNTYVGLTESEVKVIRTELKNKYRMFVGKGILSEDYGISPKSSWSDFVFSKEYELRDISEVETFIVENKHLPDVPSAKQISEEGYSQHDMNKVLLQKIEELTIYTIQQQKEIQALKAEIGKMK